MRYLIAVLILMATMALLGCGASPTDPPERVQENPAAQQETTPDGAGPPAEQTERTDGEPANAEPDAGKPADGMAGKAGPPGESIGPDPVIHDTNGMGITPVGATDRDTGGAARSMETDRTRKDIPDMDVAATPAMGTPPTELGSGPDRRDHRRRGGQPVEARLKAGEVDDNDRWDEYLRFTRDYEGPGVHETRLDDRRIIVVLDDEGKPVPNARVTILDGKKTVAEYLTYADGRTMFFPKAGRHGRMTMTHGNDPEDLRVKIERDGFTGELDLGKGDVHEVTLDGTMTYGDNIPLDVLFLLDATGSMADEINQIKSTLQSISQQVSRLPSNPDLRFGMVAYRDRGDEYVTRQYPFESNVQQFSRSIEEVRADGGDDYPESLNQALHEAVNDMRWRDDAIRLVFLVADAPPHLDYSQDEDYAVDMVRAREAGIKIFAVASSGLDEQGEYVFRQLAQQTMGRFLFILYRSGPQGALDTPHDVEQFTVNQLDSLIVRLIQEELTGLTGSEQSGMSMR